MKRKLMLLVLFIMVITSGCFAIHRDNSVIAPTLAPLAKEIRNNTPCRVVVSAYDFQKEDTIILRVVVNSENVDEQYEIINSVVCSIDDYILNHRDLIDGTKFIGVGFRLPVGVFSGVPGKELIEVTNRSDNGVYEDSLVEIIPRRYGIETVRENRMDGSHVDYSFYDIYEIPDCEFSGIHIMRVQWDIEDELIDEYLSSWPSIDTVYVDTTERAEELHDRYPDITFIGSDTNENG